MVSVTGYGCIKGFSQGFSYSIVKKYINSFWKIFFLSVLTPFSGIPFFWGGVLRKEHHLCSDYFSYVSFRLQYFPPLGLVSADYNIFFMCALLVVDGFLWVTLVFFVLKLTLNSAKGIEKLNEIKKEYSNNLLLLDSQGQYDLGFAFIDISPI